MGILAIQVEEPYWQDVMLEMEKAGTKIAAVVTHYRDVGAPNHFFDTYNPKQIPGKKFYRYEDVAELLIKDFGLDLPALDKKIIDDFESVERDFYNLSDRFCYFPKSFRYRKRLFRECLRYWLAFYQHNKITTMFSACTAHNPGDYVAFHVARYLGIPTILTAHTMINDHILVRKDYRDPEIIPAGFMQGASDEEIKAAIDPKVYSSAMAESKVLQIVISKNDQAVGAKNKAMNKKDFGRFWKRITRKSPRFKGALAMNGLFPPSIRRIIKVREILFQRRVQAYHDKLAIKPDLSQKYIYFAMHLQPERTSTPEAEIFEDHMMAIRLLSQTLPKDWVIYVKENPRQYNKINFIKGRHYRDETDYDELLKLRNVKLVDQKTDSKDLVKSAQAVATLSGSVGWEAIRAGKPVIVFANAWYAACESVFRVNNLEEAAAAIAEAQKSTPAKVHTNILRYLAYIQTKLTVGSMGYIKAASLPYEEIVSKMAERLVRESKQG